jgi:hypothetical protein
MPELLHEIDVFTSLADGAPGLARDWANARLALFAPRSLKWFPEEPLCADVTLAANPPGIVDTVIQTLASASPVSEQLASATTALGAYGVMPAAPHDLVTALRGAQAKATPEAAIWLALACSLAGDVQPADIQAAAKAENPEKAWILPTLLLALSEKNTAVDLRQLARELLPRMLGDRQLLPAILETLGTPASSAFLTPIDSLEQAVATGAAWAGARCQELHLGKGGQRKRYRKAMLLLLEKQQGPAASWLSLLCQEPEAVRLGYGPVVVASWIRHYSPGNPVFDVLRCSAGTNGHALSRARGLINETNLPELLEALEQAHPVEASILALELRSEHANQTTAGLLSRVRQPGESHLRAEVPAIVAFARLGDEIAGLITQEETVDIGLTLAEWSPTIPVLSALLQLPIPSRQSRLNRYARALASMGDIAAYNRLSQLTLGDEYTALWCQKLGSALLGQST